MSDSRVIFHVGWPKTATTSMQAELGRYPNLAGKPFGHIDTAIAVPVIDAIVRSHDWTPGDLDELIHSARHDAQLPVLLSDEVLIAMPQREWFENLVGPFEVAERIVRATGDKRVFFTLRDPRRQLRSTWLHHVREGRVQTYPEFIERVAKDRAERRGTFAIAALVKRYAELLGADRLAVGFTETYTSDPYDFWRRFGVEFGIPRMEDFVEVGGSRQNETVLGPMFYEMAVNRALRLYGSVRRRDDVRPIRRKITRKVSRRIPADHAAYFSRHAKVEDRLVNDLTHDIELVKEMIRTI